MTSLRKSLTLSLTGALVVIFLSFLAAVHFAINQVAKEQLLMHLAHDGNSLISALSIDDHGRLHLRETSIEDVYLQPHSGHYYTVSSMDGELVSPSLGNAAPFASSLPPGQHVVLRSVGPDQQNLLVLVRSLIFHGKPVQIAVAEDLADLHRGVREQSLFILIMILPGMILALLLQRYIVNRQLAPLMRAGIDLQRLGRGEIKHCEMKLPAEVQPLMDEVNRLLLLVSRRLSQSRTALGNVAHALKTPLAVLFRQAEDPALPPELRKTLQEQTQAIHSRLECELKRARLSGIKQSGVAVQVQAELADLSSVLRAIYRDKQLDIQISAPNRALPYDREDLLELIGNLSDNACKWAKQRVRIDVSEIDQGLQVRVSDDGAGCTSNDHERMGQRGTRLDESVPGHGLGLAICREITDFYQGQLSFETDPELGGLAVIATLRSPAGLA
jgi:signal transduction histidine kinase